MQFAAESAILELKDGMFGKMDISITRFNLKNFRELIPLLMRCFPDFWEPRLAEGKYSFPYDLKLFTARLERRIIGCIGLHEYTFLLDGLPVRCGGVCDVAVDPDFRGRGYASELQKFFISQCERRYDECSLTALYTDKPGVYTRLGWRIFDSDRSSEIKTADFPPEKTFRFRIRKISLAFLQGKHAPRNPEEEKAAQIMKIYDSGKIFDGKCLRTAKTWWELFAAADHHWRLEKESFFLYKNGVLLEAYSADPAHKVSRFTPRCGGFDEGNKLMLNLPQLSRRQDGRIAEALKKGSLVFPAADIF